MNSVNLLPTDVPQKLLKPNTISCLILQSLIFTILKKKIMTEAVVKMLKKVADLSNSNLIKNADGILLGLAVSFSHELSK